MTRAVVLLALLAACANPPPSAHRDCTTRVQLDGVSPATLAAASDIWRPLGVAFEPCDTAHDLTARLGDVPYADANGAYYDERALVVIEHDDALLLAHELGHALGLDHVPQMPCAVMSPGACSMTLTDADRAEFERTAR